MNGPGKQRRWIPLIAGLGLLCLGLTIWNRLRFEAATQLAREWAVELPTLQSRELQKMARLRAGQFSDAESLLP